MGFCFPTTTQSDEWTPLCYSGRACSLHTWRQPSCLGNPIKLRGVFLLFNLSSCEWSSLRWRFRLRVLDPLTVNPLKLEAHSATMMSQPERLWFPQASLYMTVTSLTACTKWCWCHIAVKASETAWMVWFNDNNNADQDHSVSIIGHWQYYNFCMNSNSETDDENMHQPFVTSHRVVLH